MREERIVIPTYPVGAADPDPIFYSQESYQGAQKHVYPYALQDRLSHVREDRTYTALTLENEFVKLTVLPEIGGRLFEALDKTNNHHFFYRQHVIKPALIGMLGAWISGGVEWCAFHHHRNTTFMPVDYRLIANTDGSKTIWFGEIERRHRMKWLIGLTLRPGSSAIETTVKLINRTAQPHSILYWANVAVHVNEDYQVIFPPSVQVATHHAKIDFTHWPVSLGKYLGADLSGRDLSWWRSCDHGASFFAWELGEDFMGGYDHGRRAGVAHVGDHHVVCGAKLWTWGNGLSGKLWDKILTDADGPYVELMVGAWSDNQPDYSWIKPYETKVIKQYWYPVREIGAFKNANLYGAVNLELLDNNLARMAFNTTSRHANARIILRAKRNVVHEETIEIGPDRPFTREVAIPAGTPATNLRVSLVSAEGEELIAYQPIQHEPVVDLPNKVVPPPKPQQIQNTEELYLTGLRVEQINNPSVDPRDYYREALKRDPADVRSNIILGIHANKRALYDVAEKHLRKAIERLSADYTRPKDTEAYYQLGLSLRAQGRIDEAIDTFERAAWDQAFHSAARHQLAELLCVQGRYGRALEQIDQSLSTNQLNTKARALKAMILNRLDRRPQAKAVALDVLSDDPLDFFAGNELCLAEHYLKGRDTPKYAATLSRSMRDDVQSYLELAADYLNYGEWDSAIDVLSRPIRNKTLFASTYPLVHYYLGYLHERKGDNQTAGACYARAAGMPSDYCFPFRLETIDVLNAAIRVNGADARAWYYLGNLLFELQPEKAISCWEKSRELDSTFALVHRNLGWAAQRISRDVDRAVACYEQAVACNQKDPRLFLELDTLYEIASVDPVRRLAMMEPHHAVISQYQDSLLREIMVLILVGRYDQAVELLAGHHFHAREGGERLHEVYMDAHLLRGIRSLKNGRPTEALEDFRRATECPDNLATGRQGSDRRAAQVAWYTSLAHEALGQAQEAQDLHRKTADQAIASRYPEARFCGGLCLQRIGRQEEADKVFDGLIEGGKAKLNEGEELDYFAKFGERQSERARAADAHFSIALGLLGKGKKDRARAEFEQAVRLNASHVWARFQLAELQ